MHQASASFDYFYDLADAACQSRHPCLSAKSM